MEKRITDLEVKVAFQEHVIGELDEVIQVMRAQIELLQREIHSIREQQDLGEEDPDQKPPHY